jgi:L-glutamine:scyllo-inosose aminotransferase/L-glutamine:2-deoxy-scyllo-inosose/3-amino-2,3-dideoxy-scyllo-inosose aminotransferase
LTISLEALEVGFGDEVLVPGVTWVACASSVAGIGGIPILVDVEPDTLCMSVDAARRAISSRTKAILLVHTYCTIADLDAFGALSEETGVPIIEDCSQAHGARWNGRPVGTFGKIGVFSMQDTKVLTCGEGGATITSDIELYDRLQQLRADGRKYTTSPPPTGRLELEEVGAVQGRNFCLSELHAAILLDRLKHLDRENSIREQNGEYLRELLSRERGVTTLKRSPQVDKLTYFQFCLRFNLKIFGDLDLEMIRQALMEELNILVERIDNPLNNNLLYNPLRSTRTAPSMVEELHPKRFSLPVARRASQECLLIHHRALLGDKEDMEDILAALMKVKKNCEVLTHID